MVYAPLSKQFRLCGRLARLASQRMKMVKLLYHLEWGLWKGNGFSNLVNECTSGVPEESGALVKVNDSFRMKSHQPGAGRIGSHRIIREHNLSQKATVAVKRPVSFHRQNAVRDNEMDRNCGAEIEDALLN